MKVLDVKTIKGEFILVDLSEVETAKYLTNVNANSIIGNVKYMTEEQFADVVDSFELYGNINVGYKNYTEEEPVLDTAKESFESLIKSLGCNLFENPELRFSPYDPRSKTGRHEWHEKDVVELKWKQAESKTLYNPILLKKE